MDNAEKGPIARIFTRLPGFAAVTAILVGMAVALGWFFGWEGVRRVVPGFIEMRFNTALGFVLSGVALGSSCFSSLRRGLRALSNACAGLVVLLGLLTLLEYWTGADLGIDQWMVRDVADYPGDLPGRMAFHAAFSFVPLGAALLLLDRNGHRAGRWVQILALVPLLAGGSSLIGYGYDMGDFLRWKLHYTPMAIHTSVLFVLLSLGLLNARPGFQFRRWMTSSTPGGRTVRILLPGLVLFTLVLGRSIQMGFDAGYYNLPFALALFSVCNIALMGALILWSAGRFVRSDERREKAERDILDSQQLLLSVVENIPTALFLRDAQDATIQMVNHAAEDVLGLDPLKVLGKSIFDIYPRDQAEFFRSTDDDLVRHGGVMDIPEVNVSIPGKGDRLLHTRKVLIRGQDGTPRFFMGLSEDITERTKAEENQRLLASVLEQTSDGVVVVDLEGNLLQWNRGAERLLGYRAGEILGRNSRILEPDDRIGETTSKRQRILEHGQTLHYDTLRKRKDGKLVHLSVSSTPLRDGAGNLKGYSAIYRDITALKNEERKLRESEAKYREIYDNSIEGIFRTDFLGKGLQANMAFAQMLGYGSPEEAVGSIRETARDLWAEPSDRARFIELLQRDGFVKGLEALWKRKDGDVIWVKLNAKLTLDASGAALYIDGFISDITEQKRLLLAREKLEEQLRVSQKMEAIGTLAGGVAHDFNNILAVILSYTGFVLDETGNDDPKKGDLLEIKNAAERAAVLTRQLLAFGHKQMVRPVSLDLNEVTRGLEKMLRRILGEDIEFSLDLAPGLGKVLADPGQMEQVLMNLVVNARDAMPEGGELTIATADQELGVEGASALGIPPGRYVLLTVSDTGSGMEDKVKTRIFEPFFTTKPKGKGTGLGLSTVYGIVQQSKGGILLESALGKGTTFRIFLPCDLSGKGTDEAAAPAPGAARGQGTILLVEDETALLQATRRALESAGYRVLTAPNGERAIRISEEFPGVIDLLLTDVVMPGKDGVTAGREIVAKRPGLSILYMSGYSDQNGARREVLEPGHHFIGKPFTLQALTSKVQEALAKGTPAVPGSPGR